MKLMKNNSVVATFDGTYVRDTRGSVIAKVQLGTVSITAHPYTTLAKLSVDGRTIDYGNKIKTLGRIHGNALRYGDSSLGEVLVAVDRGQMSPDAGLAAAAVWLLLL